MHAPFFAALLALAAPSQDGEAVHLRYAPEPGSLLRRDLHVKHEIQLDGVSYTHEGQAPVRQDTPGWISSFVKVSVDDRIDEVAGGRPLKLRRQWVDLGAQGTLNLAAAAGRPKFEDRAVLTSPLRGRRVDFAWVEAEGDWARQWVRDDAEEFWLAEMRGDMDGLGLLPEGPVAPGAEWSVPMEAVRGLLAPGGNHLITPRTTNIFGRTMEVGIGGDGAEVLGPELAGFARATFEGVREEGGERVAALRLSIEGLRSIADRTDLWRTSAPPEEQNEVARLLSTLLEYGLDARGEVLWNLERGHLHSVTLAGEELYMLAVTKFGGPVAAPYESVQQSSFRGTLQLSYKVGPPPPPGEKPEPGAKGGH